MAEKNDNPFGAAVTEVPAGVSPEEMAGFPLNDLGNAMRLILLAGGEVRKDGRVDSRHSRLLFQLGGGWVGFNGQYWDRKHGEDLARRLAHEVSRLIPALWDHLKDRIPAKEFWRFANDTGSSGKTTAMLRQAQSYLTVEIDVFDRDPMAINCLNGTVKMRWTPPAKGVKGAKGRFEVRLQPHEPSDRITRCTTTIYDPRARAKLYRKVARESLADIKERGHFRRIMGYAATGCTHEQAFFLAQGRGRDGKSTLLDAAREVLGSYGIAGTPQTFLEGGIQTGSGPSPDLIALSGDVRLAVLSEPPRGSKLNEGRLKAWTSGTPIQARDLNAKPIEFRPRAKLFWECNAFPVAKGDDDGIWRRIFPVLFRRQVPKEEVDRTLPARLLEERAGILNWLIWGVGDWCRRGLDQPETMKAALEDYRKASSPFGDWLSERCFTGEAAKGERELSGDLYASFKAWSEEQGHEKIMSVRAFGDALRDRQVGLMGKNAAGNKYRGPIKLKTLEERARDNAEPAPQPVAPAQASAPLEGAGSPESDYEDRYYPDMDVVWPPEDVDPEGDL